MTDLTRPFSLAIRADSMSQVLRAVAGLGIQESAITQVGEPYQEPDNHLWVVHLTIDLSQAKSSLPFGGCV